MTGRKRGRTVTHKSTHARQLVNQDRPYTRRGRLRFAATRAELNVFGKVWTLTGFRLEFSKSMSGAYGRDAIRVAAWPPHAPHIPGWFFKRPCHVVAGMKMLSVPWPCFHLYRRPPSLFFYPTRQPQPAHPHSPIARPPHSTKQLL